MHKVLLGRNEPEELKNKTETWENRNVGPRIPVSATLPWNPQGTGSRDSFPVYERQ